MSRAGTKRKVVFADEVSYSQIKGMAKRRGWTLEQAMNDVNKRRISIGKSIVFPPGSMSLLSNKRLMMPTQVQTDLLNQMSKRVVVKGKFKSTSEVAKELGKKNSTTINEHIKELKKKGFPIELFFEEKINTSKQAR